jgi:hypothetical protein
VPRQIAIDIETIETTDNPSFSAPSDWEIFAIGLAARSTLHNDIDSHVVYRTDESRDARRRLLAAAMNWLRRQCPDALFDADVPAADTSAVELCTFNGEHFDIPTILHHAKKDPKPIPDDQTLGAYVERTLDKLTHRDLMREIIERQPEGKKWPSLSEACAEQTIPFATARVDGDRGSYVLDGGQMPMIGWKLLNDELTPAERDALDEYAAQDAAVLPALADALDEERRERIEAEAETVTQDQSATNTEGSH